MAGITAPVTMAKIIEKFGGSGVLSSYRRGGGLVPDIPANAAISTTAAGLTLGSFIGADTMTEGTVQFASTVIARSRVANGGQECRAEVRFNADGNVVSYRNQNGLTTLWVWLLSGSNTEFQIYCSKGPGIALTVGTLDTWLDMTSNLTWRLATSANDRDYDATLSFQIRRKSTGAVLVTGTAQLQVTKGLA